MLSKCEWCNKDFISRPSGHRLNDGKWATTRFCSPYCSYKARVTQQLSVCAFCGKAFYANKAREARFCSRVCLHNSMKSREKVICLICGIEFEAQKHLLRKNRAKLCSVDCKKAYLSQRFSGSKHFNWKGGFNKHYPDEWTPYLRTKIKKRDNYTCQNCGVKHQPKSGLLVAHHKDENKDNCKPDNLITLCRKCHSGFHFGKVTLSLGGYCAW